MSSFFGDSASIVLSPVGGKLHLLDVRIIRHSRNRRLIDREVPGG